MRATCGSFTSLRSVKALASRDVPYPCSFHLAPLGESAGVAVTTHWVVTLSDGAHGKMGVMTTVQLLDNHARDDLELFALRAKRLDEQAIVNIEVYGRAIAAYSAPLYATGLHDAMPTVIGVRTFPIHESSVSEATPAPTAVAVTELLERLTVMRRDETYDLALPSTSASAVWLAMTPPHTGWERTGGRVRQRDVREVCEQGVRDVSEAVSETPGTVGKVGALALQKVRGRIWSEQPTSLLGAPSGVAFAADGLGFLRVSEGENVPTIAVFKHHHWYRLSFPFGEILAHSRFL